MDEAERHRIECLERYRLIKKLAAPIIGEKNVFVRKRHYQDIKNTHGREIMDKVAQRVKEHERV